MTSERLRLLFMAVLLSVVSSAQVCLGGNDANSPLSIDQQLIVACYNADLVAVRQALKQGAHVDARFGKGDPQYLSDKWTLGVPIDLRSWTPLIAAASSLEWPDPPRQIMNTEKDRLWAIQQIQQMSRAPTPAMKERQAACVEIARELIDAKCAVDLADRHGATALYVSICGKKERFARLLVERGAKTNTTTKRYIDGPGELTPLHEAYWSATLTQELLKHGADPGAKDTEGDTPLDWAKRFRHTDVLRVYERARLTGRIEADGIDCVSHNWAAKKRG